MPIYIYETRCDLLPANVISPSISRLVLFFFDLSICIIRFIRAIEFSSVQLIDTILDNIYLDLFELIQKCSKNIRING